MVQAMVFSMDHPDYPNEPKGIKFVLSECGLYQSPLHGKCQSQCDLGATACCNKQILKCQPNFQAQKSLVQDTIEDAGHLCIFLPKFHCELNFIEFFWGKAKKYIQDNCDGTFEALKKNLPLALQSVQLSTICLWEHHMQGWTQKLCKSRSRSSVQKGTSHTGEFLKLWLSPLIFKYSNFVTPYTVIPLYGQNG